MRRKSKPKMEDKSMDFLDSFNQEPVKEEAPETPTTYKVRVTSNSLRIRRAPSTQAEIVGYITDHGTYEILDEVNGWGKIEEDNWIMLSYTEIA